MRHQQSTVAEPPASHGAGGSTAAASSSTSSGHGLSRTLPHWLDTATREQLIDMIQDLTAEVHRLDTVAVAASVENVRLETELKALRVGAQTKPTRGNGNDGNGVQLQRCPRCRTAELPGTKLPEGKAAGAEAGDAQASDGISSPMHNQSAYDADTSDVVGGGATGPRTPPLPRTPALPQQRQRATDLPAAIVLNSTPQLDGKDAKTLCQAFPSPASSIDESTGSVMGRPYPQCSHLGNIPPPPAVRGVTGEPHSTNTHNDSSNKDTQQDTAGATEADQSCGENSSRSSRQDSSRQVGGKVVSIQVSASTSTTGPKSPHQRRPVGRRRSLPQLPAAQAPSGAYAPAGNKRKRPPPLLLGALEPIPGSPAAPRAARSASPSASPNASPSTSPSATHTRQQQQRPPSRLSANASPTPEPYPISAELADAVGSALARSSPQKVEAARTIQVLFRQRKLEQQYLRARDSALRRSRLRRQGSDTGSDCMPLTPTPPTPQSNAAVARPSWAATELCDTRAPAELQRLRRLGVYHFNRSPMKGVDWLINERLVPDDAAELARFLKTEPCLSRKMIGEFFGRVSCSFSMEVLRQFTLSFNLSGVPFDAALRGFLTSFRLPGEAQKIEKILEVFAEQFHSCNPGVFSNPDTPFILAFSVVMLNTDAHNEANKRKMTKDQFVSNNRGIDDGQDLPSTFLEEIYCRIVAEEFQTAPDNTSLVEDVVSGIQGLEEDFVQPHRQFLGSCAVVEFVQNDGERSGSKGKRSARHLFLFNDILLVTKQKTKGQSRCVLKQTVPLLGCHLMPTSQPHPQQRAGNTQAEPRKDEAWHQLVTSYDGKSVLQFLVESNDANVASSANVQHQHLASGVFMQSLQDCIRQCQELEAQRMAVIRPKRRMTEDDSIASPAVKSPLRRSFGSLEDIAQASREQTKPIGQRHGSISLMQRLNHVPSMFSKRLRGRGGPRGGSVA
eukprot:m.79549 g.79549  ORF g.79549 m.79549 type:complete len:958 (+) comp14629_c0_seq4:225-3098(+)